MLQNRIIPSLADKHLLERTIFMQDGAPPHIARRVKDLLRRSFGDDRVLSRHFHHVWPPRSPDLSPCDYWLWGYLKSQVYRDRLNISRDAERQHPTPVPHHNSGHALQCCSQHYS
ncbi:uncharacterized protein TNCV_2934931 [Trichonephila clavipes]|nr:uncharacterized protein TNCV_2934931 [Trichonephila clavipes]